VGVRRIGVVGASAGVVEAKEIVSDGGDHVDRRTVRHNTIVIRPAARRESTASRFAENAHERLVATKDSPLRRWSDTDAIVRSHDNQGSLPR
jgi:hypothetical protein